MDTNVHDDNDVKTAVIKNLLENIQYPPPDSDILARMADSALRDAGFDSNLWELVEAARKNGCLWGRELNHHLQHMPFDIHQTVQRIENAAFNLLLANIPPKFPLNQNGSGITDHLLTTTTISGSDLTAAKTMSATEAVSALPDPAGTVSENARVKNTQAANEAVSSYSQDDLGSQVNTVRMKNVKTIQMEMPGLLKAIRAF